MNGNYFKGAARAYAHKWLGEQEQINRHNQLENLKWGRKAASYSGLAAIFGAFAAAIALIQLIITWLHG